LEEAAKMLEFLPEKMVNTVWQRVAAKELPEKEHKSNKSPFKKSLKKTLAAFKVIILLPRLSNKICTLKFNSNWEK
jgi:hypothetical protein